MMLCNNIAEMTIKYLDNKLDVKIQARFERHISRCKKCRIRFVLMKENYNADLNVLERTDELASRVMNKINPNRYSAALAKRSYRRLITGVCTVAVILLIIAISQFAGNNTLVEHKNDNMVVDNNIEMMHKKSGQIIENMNKILLSSPKKKAVVIQTSNESVYELYIRHKDMVNDTLEKMKPGEVKRLTFDEEQGTFYIHFGKGKVTDTIAYGMEENQSVYFASEVDRERYLKQFIDNGYFAAAFDKLPEGFEIGDVMGSQAGLSYITYDKINEYPIYLFFNKDLIFLGKEYDSSSIESINGYQAVYCEISLGAGNIGQLHIFLGDDKLYKVVTLASRLDGSVNRESLIEMANQIKFYNELNNYRHEDIATNDNNYDAFTKIYGPINQEKLDRISDLLKQEGKGAVEELGNGVTFQTHGSEGARSYSIRYEGTDLNAIKPYFVYPMPVSSKLSEKLVLVNTTILGSTAEAYKHINIDYATLSLGKWGFSDPDLALVSINAGTFERYDLYLNAFDRVIFDYIGAFEARRNRDQQFTSVKLLFDKTGHPYYSEDVPEVNEYGHTNVFEKYIRTAKYAGDRLVSYNIGIRNIKNALNGMTEEEFVKSLEFVQ